MASVYRRRSQVVPARRASDVLTDIDTLKEPIFTADAPIVERVLRPFQQFAATEATDGIVLLACSSAALLWANSSSGDPPFICGSARSPSDLKALQSRGRWNIGSMTA
jgi:hypothetical protein